jgi:non-heme chloroperoxidase
MNRRTILLTAAAALGATAANDAQATARARPAARTQTGRRPQIVTRDGTHLFHRDWGEGRPTVFLSGWALNSEAWAYQAAELSDQGLRCIAYDRRGHGRSDDPGRGYDLDTLADDLHAVMETLDLHDAVLVSHSFGGKEITRYLSRHGAGRVSRLVFLAPAMPFLLKTADNPYGAPAEYFEGVQAQWRADFARWVDENSAAYVTPGTSQGLIDWTKRQMLEASLRAVLDVGRVNLREDMRAELGRITLPSLVIHGTKDASAPLDITGRRVAALIPGAELKVYEGAPHGLYITHMAKLNADLLAFAKA